MSRYIVCEPRPEGVGMWFPGTREEAFRMTRLLHMTGNTAAWWEEFSDSEFTEIEEALFEYVSTGLARYTPAAGGAG